MNLLANNIDSTSIKALLIICLFICGQMAQGQSSNEQLDPLSILSSEITEKTLPIKVDIIEEQIDAPVEQTTPTTIKISQGLKAFGTLLAANFNHDNIIKPEVSKKPEIAKQYDIKEKELIREKISAVVEKDKSKNKDRLQKLIQQIGSIKVKPKSQVNTTEQTQPPLDNEMSNEIHENKTSENIVKPVNDTERFLDTELISKIEHLKSRPETVRHPFMLAELLLLNGYHEYAAYFFNTALQNKEESQKLDKAWVLLQKANCQKQYEPQRAIETYKQIIAEYPDSPWVQPALANQKLLDLYQQQEPKKLIEQCKKQLVNFDYSNGAAQK